MSSSTSKRPAFVCWIGYQGRSGDLAAALDADLWLVPSVLPVPDTPVFAPIRYIDQTIRTVVRVLRARPSGFVVMQPPVVSLALIVLLARSRPVVADFHHDPFEEPKWKWSLRPSLWLARRCALSLVTNQAHADIVRAAGAPVAVLHDPPVPTPEGIVEPTAGAHVLVPSSYSPDEPVAELLDAARTLPDVEFRLTGRAPETVVASAPANVTFTGFVTDAEYAELVATAQAIVCLTDKPNTMQRGGYEAMSTHRPLVTADSDVLRDYFGDAASYCSPRDPASIAAAVKTCIADRVAASDRMRIRHQAILAAYVDELRPVRDALGH